MQTIYFLSIRIRQLLRELRRLGPVYAFVLIASAFGAFSVFYVLQKDHSHILYSYVALILMLLFIHVSRSDHKFIQMVGINKFAIYFAEYFFLILPFIFLTAIKSHEFIHMLVVIPVALISLLKVKYGRGVVINFPVALIGYENFEWKSGFRKSGWVILLLLIVALILTPVPYVSVVPLWFCLLIISSFYEANESRIMVESFELSSMKFLMKKSKIPAFSFVLLILPVLCASFFFFPGNWWVSLFFICFCIINISVFVATKYATWAQGEVHKSGTLINSMCLLGFFLPFLLPLPLFVLVRNMRRAVNNLNPILHAYN